MIPLLTDEDFDHAILRGMLRSGALDILAVREVGLGAAHDRVVLAWAAAQHRVLLTRDVTTMTNYAYERIRQGLSMPGVFAVRQSLAIGKAVDDLLILAECSAEGEWEGRVLHLPL